MAGFSDNLGALTNFNPYVQQLPIEAMVSVGQQKQQQYNEGVQKIQGHIDQIAGMDVVRDVDKEYLQSKLNTLGSNLKKVAAGDFSNYQLVSSVSGMASRIGKDINVQNAVASTMRYRKGVADMETAKKEGKSSPSNEWDFANQANQWMSNPDVKASFTGGYNPYTNYKKNALEVIKSLTKDESITDDAFTMDSKGNLVVADSTVRKKLAGIDPAKIQTALMATLTPADFKQMEIDGRYTYSNADPRRLAQTVTTSYDQKIGYYNEQKKVLENAKSSTSSNAIKNELNDKIASLDKTISGITREHQSVLEQISSGNAEGVKAQMYTNDFMDNFSKAFSYTETSQTYVGKTPQEVNMWRADKEQDWKKFILNYDWDKTKFAITTQQKERELTMKGLEVSGYGGLPGVVPQKDLPTYTLDRIANETTQKREEVQNADNSFMRQQGKDEEWLKAQKEAWERSPEGVDPIIKNHFQQTAQKRREADANEKMIGEIRKQAEEKFGTIDQYIPEDARNLVLWDNEVGGRLVYTPKELAEYNTKKGNFVTVEASSGGSGAAKAQQKFDYEKAKQELTPKEYKLFEAFARNETATDKQIVGALQEINAKVNRPYKSNLEQINAFTAEEVTKRITSQQGVGYVIPTTTPALRESMGGNLLNFANKVEGLKGKPGESPDFDVATAKILASDPSTKYIMTLQEGTQYDPIPKYEITASSDKGSVKFNVTPEEKISMFGDLFEPTREVRAFRPYQEQIRKMGGYTTGFTSGPSNHESAFLDKTDFPNVKSYGIKANIVQPSPGQYSIRISAFDPITQKWNEDMSYPREALVSEEQVTPLLEQLSDEAVYELVTGEKPNTQILKQLNKLSKNPL